MSLKPSKFLVERSLIDLQVRLVRNKKYLGRRGRPQKSFAQTSGNVDGFWPAAIGNDDRRCSSREVVRWQVETLGFTVHIPDEHGDRLFVESDGASVDFYTERRFVMFGKNAVHIPCNEARLSDCRSAE